jgi:hypothetical protein
VPEQPTAFLHTWFLATGMKTKCYMSLDSALHKIAWYNLESLATKEKKLLVIVNISMIATL